MSKKQVVADFFLAVMFIEIYVRRFFDRLAHEEWVRLI